MTILEIDLIGRRKSQIRHPSKSSINAGSSIIIILTDRANILIKELLIIVRGQLKQVKFS